MIVFPNCKINLGLHIVAKREDGYHNIETIFYPVPWNDILEIIENKNYTSGSEKYSFLNTGIQVDSAAENNLCVKAYKLLDKKYNLPPVKIHLHKIIPFGAGLGSASSDAAFTLNLLNKKFNLNISETDLRQFALQIGSDCAFFINPVAALASGKGEILSLVNINLAGMYIVIVKPDFGISTKEAYSQVTPAAPVFDLSCITQITIADWKNKLVNDFEIPLFEKYPQLDKIKNFLYYNGAIYASMSGSGSALYGLFLQEPAVQMPFATQKIFTTRLT